MRKCKLLFLSSDKYPPFRVDVKVLFGKELAGRGHIIDLILQAEKDCQKTFVADWFGCRVFVGKNDTGDGIFSRVLKHLYDLLNDLKVFKLIREAEYDFVLVKDKYISAVLGSVIFATIRRSIAF